MASPIPLSETLVSSRLRGLIPENVQLCFQCQKCASGCQLLGLTPGPEELGLKRHLVDPMPLLAKVV